MSRVYDRLQESQGAAWDEIKVADNKGEQPCAVAEAGVEATPTSQPEPNEKPKAAVAAAAAGSDEKRVNVIFSSDQYNTLKTIADKQEISVSDALRQAIKIAKLIVDANEDPEERVLLQRGKEVRELKIL